MAQRLWCGTEAKALLISWNEERWDETPEWPNEPAKPIATQCRSAEREAEVELVVSAVRGSIYRGGVAAFLQQDRTQLGGDSLLLLVSAPMGDHRRRSHGDR